MPDGWLISLEKTLVFGLDSDILKNVVFMTKVIGFCQIGTIGVKTAADIDI